MTSFFFSRSSLEKQHHQQRQLKNAQLVLVVSFSAPIREEEEEDRAS
jgi:hypothetical protein